MHRCAWAWPATRETTRGASARAAAVPSAPGAPRAFLFQRIHTRTPRFGAA